MAIKGAIAKAEIMEQIYALYPEAFSPDGKVIHVNKEENGALVQIKITFTAAKTPLENTSKSEVVNEELFHISDNDKTKLEDALEEMGIPF